MTIKCLGVAMLAVFTVSCSFAGDAAPKEYKGGSGESVKPWVARDYAQLKGGFQPMVIYIYDASLKRNLSAFHYEGAEGLNNATVKDKISKFTKIKIKTDGTDVKGWPDDMLKPAKGGAVLVLMSSDHTIPIVFAKAKDASKEAIEAAAATIQAHEDKLKAAREKEDKKAAIVEKAKEKEQEKEKGPDLTIKLDTKKPEPKKPADKAKPGDKVADAKAGADAKNAAATSADPKKDAMKKAPQDE